MKRAALPAELEAAVPVPRSNGELVFAAPWQSRVFAMAVALEEEGVYDWDAFRRRLIDEIAVEGRDDGSRYYEHWLRAFERVLLDHRVVTSAEIDRRAHDVAETDDHAHEH